ncbi:DUF5690 family protein [Chitinophaga rhizosphaerae]|uniref:DUF5690 family protein n=1 Tax=Chitinophaga rhizosphaerae TaxID=1864947 RepID=UPI00196B7508|nr:DUF5690 family protein [Chitinophaga rhizosphaerae]
MIHKRLQQPSGVFFIAWCLLASFGTYFCMYAFRKPFNTGLYEGLTLFGLGYKTVLIIAQVLGYMVSKFAGIKIISELRPEQRIRLVACLIGFALLALLGFALVPHPYNFFFLFLNGLPLGMVWGVIFSFLEGRRFTEILGMGLSISIIAASGILKTIYLEIQSLLPWITEFWMPFVIGLLFIPLTCLFIWMLSVIPAPSETDKLLRAERAPMTPADKSDIVRNFWPGLLCILLIYCLLTTLRDFRDNFSVEIWNEIGGNHWSRSILAQTELISTVIVVACVSCLSLIRNNIRGLWATKGLIAIGIIMTGASTLLYHRHAIGPYGWMLTLGTGLFLAYIPIQVALFERLIALFKLKANAGFFVYGCDAIGYLGSVGLLLYREFFMKDLRWSRVLMQFSYLLCFACLALLITAFVYFNRKHGIRNLFRKTEAPVTPNLHNFTIHL